MSLVARFRFLVSGIVWDPARVVRPLPCRDNHMSVPKVLQNVLACGVLSPNALALVRGRDVSEGRGPEVFLVIELNDEEFNYLAHGSSCGLQAPRRAMTGQCSPNTAQLDTMHDRPPMRPCLCRKSCSMGRPTVLLWDERSAESGDAVMLNGCGPCFQCYPFGGAEAIWVPCSDVFNRMGWLDNNSLTSSPLPILLALCTRCPSGCPVGMTILKVCAPLPRWVTRLACFVHYPLGQDFLSYGSGVYVPTTKGLLMRRVPACCGVADVRNHSSIDFFALMTRDGGCPRRARHRVCPPCSIR